MIADGNQHQKKQKTASNYFVRRFLTLWAQLGSNQRPKDYESSTLTN